MSRRRCAVATRVSAIACFSRAVAAAISSAVSARATSLVVRPVLALISVRASSIAPGGNASPQVRWPFSSQQYSFLPPFCCAPAVAATASSSNALAMRFMFMVCSPCSARSSVEYGWILPRASVTLAIREQRFALAGELGAFPGEREQVVERGHGDDRDRERGEVGKGGARWVASGGRRMQKKKKKKT